MVRQRLVAFMLLATVTDVLLVPILSWAQQTEEHGWRPRELWWKPSEDDLTQIRSGQRKDLSFVDLSETDLSGANLTEARLDYALLLSANLGGANLTGAELHGANLSGAELAGANLTSVGDFVDEVRYDPEIYFLGEEIMLTVRAFTHGYDLFHPLEHIVWHEYTRPRRPKHWDDHLRIRGIEVEWHHRDAVSRSKVTRFLTAPHVGLFGCGVVRTLRDYEAYAGLSFRHRAVEDYTLSGREPPNPCARLNSPAEASPTSRWSRLRQVQVCEGATMKVLSAFEQGGIYLSLGRVII
jgi:hypothetical protein